MRVEDVMNREPRTVTPHDHLGEAARVMSERDCGWLPVVDGGGRVVGVITDRDICMAALTRGRALNDVAVEGTMSTDVRCAHPRERLADALAAMSNYRVRRLPVVDDEGVICGVLSLSDLARRAAVKDGLRPRRLVATMAAIVEPRSAEPYA